VLFDGVVLPEGPAGVELLSGFVEVMDFISNQYRHGKTILVLGASKKLLLKAGVDAHLSNGEPDPGIVFGGDAKADRSTAQFIAALGRHRHPERERGA
jgi:catalase